MSEQNNSVPIWFWVIAVLALVWNVMGVIAYVADVTQTAEQIAARGQAVQDIYAIRPAWAVGAFAIAVLAGVIGSVLLLLRRSLAMVFFVVSFLSVIVQDIFFYGIAKAHQTLQAGDLTMSGVVLFITVFLVVFTRSANSKGWLH